MIIATRSTKPDQPGPGPGPRPRPPVSSQPQPPMPASWPGVSLAALAVAGILAVFASPASAQDFKCSGKLKASEKAICDHQRLSRMDDSMASYYGQLWGRLNHNHREGLRDNQRDFLADRNKCGSDQYCLKDAYRDRIAVLKRQLNRTEQR